MYTFLKLIFIFSSFLFNYLIIHLFTYLLIYFVLTMVHNIEALVARIDLLESRIQLLISSHVQNKKKFNSGFQAFAQSMIHHVRSDICKKHFDTFHTHDFKPKYTHVLQEISLLWSSLDPELKAHFITSAHK